MKYCCLTLSALLLFSCQKNNPSSSAKSDAPVVTGISPATAIPGGLDTICGHNFDTTLSGGDTVRFGDAMATIYSITDTMLIVRVPGGGITGPITVTTDKGVATGPVFTYGPDVYVAGYENEGDYGNTPIAAFWKDGIRSLLTGPDSWSIAYGMAMADTNVYISGIVSASFLQALYWQNGAIFRLLEGTTMSYGSAMAVSGGNTYVAGFIQDEANEGPPYAVYWKNGVPDTLAGGQVAYCQATAITLAGSDVYVGGFLTTRYDSIFTISAVYWKNGQMVTLPPVHIANNDHATGIAVNGSDVYVVGYESGYEGVAVLWKNGVATPLSNGKYGSVATSICVIGSDTYIGGYEVNEAGFQVAKYWKNGVAVSLTDGTRNAAVNAITVAGGNVYAAGYESSMSNVVLSGDPDYGFVAKYWENDVAVQLGNGFVASQANAICIK